MYYTEKQDQIFHISKSAYNSGQTADSWVRWHWCKSWLLLLWQWNSDASEINDMQQFFHSSQIVCLYTSTQVSIWSVNSSKFTWITQWKASFAVFVFLHVFLWTPNFHCGFLITSIKYVTLVSPDKVKSVRWQKNKRTNQLTTMCS